MPRKFTRVNAVEKNGQRRTVLDSVVGGGPYLRWACSAMFHVCGRGAFGEIALPRRCMGDVDFWEDSLLWPDELPR